MKAKEYVKLLKECKNEEEIQLKITGILKMFIVEISDLMQVRSAKSISAMKSIMTELNKKWVAFVILLSKSDISTYGIDISPEMFYAALVATVPESKQILKDEIKNIPTIKEEVPNSVSNIRPYVVTPFEKITKKYIISEILCCLSALSNYNKNGLPLEVLKPLINRISFLRYWERNGINYDEIKSFEDNADEFLKDKLHKLY